MLQQPTDLFWKTKLWEVWLRGLPHGLCLGGAASILIGSAILVANKAGASIPLDPVLLKLFVAAGAVMGIVGAGSYHVRVTRGRLNWLTANANWAAQHIQLLARTQAAAAASDRRDSREVIVVGKSDAQPPTVDRWPWGSHHTEMLGHVEAAARKWWANYDPTSPDTAPTNDMVAEWLCDVQGVSKDKAKAIASILRADGLRTGPRR